MNAIDKIKRLYKSSEISPTLEPKINILNMTYQFIYSTTIAIISTVFPIRYGFIYISRLIEKGGSEGNPSLSIKEGLVTFEGGAGSFLIFIGFLFIFVTTYRVFVKK